MFDERPGWCPFNINGEKIEHEGVACLETKKEFSYRHEAYKVLYQLYRYAVGCDKMTMRSYDVLYFVELMTRYIRELEKKIGKEKKDDN